MELEKPKIAFEKNLTADEMHFRTPNEVKFRDLNILKEKDVVVSKDLQILNKRNRFKPKDKIILKQNEQIKLKNEMILNQTKVIELQEEELERYRRLVSSYHLSQMGRDLTIKRLQAELKK